MRLEIWIIGVMIFLVAGVLALIAASPDDISVPKSTHVAEISESISIKEPTTSMSVPAPEDKDIMEEEFSVELKESISVDEFEAEPEPMKVEEKPSLPDLVEVNVAEGSGVPGCEETNECFIPYEVSIAVEGEVIWNNGDSAAHTVTSGNPTDGPDGIFDSSLFMSGTTFSHIFDEAGTYEYFCMVHPWMKGTVQVS
ncbi:MAG TPA: plastocyanin/azurin family copper-binding protein [Nitrosopumilaceae archaeon]|nr:plastocyanin/azurin family copper-binding protein [Nitrosopumilaceae archaeon]